MASAKQLLLIHLMQQWYSLSDPAMEDALIEEPTMWRFTGIDMISDRITDETMILAFRHLLEKHNLGEQIDETVNVHLKERGMAMKQGTMIDVTLISAASSTLAEAAGRAWRSHSNQDGNWDQTKMGNQWNHRSEEGCAYGMQIHNGLEKVSGLIHAIVTTAANVHALTPAADLLHGDEEVVYGVAAGFCEAVAGYQGIAKRPETAVKAHRRAKLDHPYRVINQQFGFQKTRLRGMVKRLCKVNVLAALTN